MLSRLRDFRRRYYLNEITRGLLLALAILLLSYLLVAVLEYMGRFGTTARAAIFYGFIALNGAVFIRYIILPLLRLLELRKGLSPEQAAVIIGRHFSDVSDKLLNTLQLHEQAEKAADPLQRELIEAGISQKIAQLSPVPFARAVNFRLNRRYVKWVALPLLLLGGIWFISPKILRDSTTRLVAYNTHFEREAPFSFVLQNKDMRAMRGDDFTIKVKVEGDELPAEAFIMVDGQMQRMKKVSKTAYTFDLTRLSKPTYELRFAANSFTTKPYLLTVSPRAVLQRFQVVLDYPDYTGRKDETIENAGDLTLPQGTQVRWRFETSDAESLTLLRGAKPVATRREGENSFVYDTRFMASEKYQLLTGNRFMRAPDTVSYQINIIPDQAPAITATEQRDSSQAKAILFRGEINDDYGFSRLRFVYRFVKRGEQGGRNSGGSIALPLAPGRAAQPFSYYWDMAALNVGIGDELEYYFEVSDNDAVNGPKTTRSATFMYRAPDRKELERELARSSEQLQKDMDEAMRRSMEIQKELEKTRRRLLEKKNLDYQDKKQLSDLLKKQQELRERLKELERQYDENIRRKNDLDKPAPELQERREQLREIMRQMDDPELKKLAEEIQKSLDKDRKDQLNNNLDKMQQQEREVMKNLDRLQELYKQMEVEEKLDEAIDKLDKLEKQQEELASKTESNKGNDKDRNEELKKQQEELAKDFEELKKDMSEIQRKNEELENKNSLEDTRQEEQNIDKAQDESQDALDKNNSKKAAEKQKKAAAEMKAMKQKMKKSQMQMQQEAQAEDYNSLRQIMDNIIYVSKEQEQLALQFKTLRGYNQLYVELAQRQRKLKEDAKIIEDSLLALSKRVPQISSFVNKEIGEINFNMSRALDALGDRNTGEASVRQQYAMMHLNNLALMLSESMQEMQQQMNEAMQQQGNSKPQKKKGKQKGESLAKMRQMQEQLSKDLEEAKKALEKQQRDGKPATDEATSKKLAEMAARQEALRRELHRINEERKKNGQQPLGDMDRIEQLMEKQEEDIVNKRVTDMTLRRQKEIETRMLDSERAERMQEQDEERKAEQGIDKKNPNPPLLEEYLKLKNKEAETLRLAPPAYNEYYRQRIKSYFGTGR